MKRHLVVTTYVVCNVGGEKKLLLVRHRKLNTWLPPGGHVDWVGEAMELPDEAALREVREETGVEAQFAGNREDELAQLQSLHIGATKLLHAPNHIQLEEIEPGVHFHIDLVYFARAPPNSIPKAQEDEVEGARWFNLEGLKELGKEAEAWPEVVFFGTQALREVEA